MSKIYELNESTKEVFEEIIRTSNINEQLITIEILGKKMKGDLYKVGKSGDFAQFKLGVDVIVLVDEDIFILLNPENQIIAATEALCGISWDVDKEAMVLSKPDIQTFSGVLEKFTNDKVLFLKQAIKLAQDSRAQTEKENKEIEKEKKKKF